MRFRNFHFSDSHFGERGMKTTRFTMDRLEDRITPSYACPPYCNDSHHGGSKKDGSKKGKSKKGGSKKGGGKKAKACKKK